ncbi:MAG: acyltransferase [Clostridia bacterium]|nr:acyltransferase [Clostridia bacterium]
MRRINCYPVKGHNSLWYWPKIINPLKVVKNFIVIQFCRYSPSLRLKNFLYRTFLKTEVGPYPSVGLMVMLDIFYPEKIKIGSNVIIGYNSTILCHEFLRNEYRIGNVIIEDDVMVGANTTILPGVTIGKGAVVSACSLVNRDIPPYTFVGGVPARVIKNLRKEDAGSDS